jgi:hypothetical protein
MDPDEIAHPSVSAGTLGESLGTMESMEEVQMLQSEHPVLRIRGLHARRGTTHQRPVPLQLVIRGSSSVNIRGIYRRLIKRCLIAMKGALVHGVMRGDRCVGAVGVLQQERTGMVMAPCGGTNEMAWAILWEKVGDRVEQLIREGAAETPPYNSSNSSCGDEVAVPTPFFALADSLAIDLLRDVFTKSGASPPLELVDLCRVLSSAYMTAPLTLLRNKIAASSAAAGQDARARRLCLEWKGQLCDILRNPPVPSTRSGRSVGEGRAGRDVQAPARKLHMLREGHSEEKENTEGLSIDDAAFPAQCTLAGVV